MKSPKLLQFPSFLTIKIFLFWVILFLPHLVSAQTDKTFWFVAPNVYGGDRLFNKPINLRITTSSSAATVVISMPADPSFTPIAKNIGANSTETVDLTPWIDQLQNTPANRALNKGLLITSTADITAYYEVVSGFCNCNPEIFSLKGKNALGTEFFISSQYTYDESTAYSGTNSFDIVATENNTHVTITPKKNIVGHNANIPFTIVLNKGQTYSAEASSSSAVGHLQGSYISSDNPIAVTLKDDLVQVSSCADLIGDQAVPTNVLGTEYIVTKGFLDSEDKVYVLAVEDNTSIYTDGNATPMRVLAKGESTTLDLSDPSIYIRSDKKIYVYHLTGNGCEVGSAVIPKLNCTGSRSVSVVRSKNELFSVMITTKNGNQNSFTVNGSNTLIKSSDFFVVPGTGGAYVTSRIDLSSGVSVGSALTFANSSGNFSLAFINGGKNTGTLYGFFSDFKSSNVDNASVETCPAVPVQMSAYGGVSYKWSPATGLSNPNIANPKASPTTTTDYTVAITTADGCIDYANVHVKVLSGAPSSITIASSANNICPGTLVTFTATPINGGNLPVYQWQVNGINAGTNSAIFSSRSLINGDKVTCILASNAVCAPPGNVISNSITMNVITTTPASVTIAASQNNICTGTVVNFTATPINAGDNPVYQWEINGLNVGTNSTSFSSSSLVNGDKVSFIMATRASACTVSTNPTSNVITMIVNDLPASVSIAPSQNNVCAGTTVRFTATPVNGGTVPIYQWQINGVNAGTNSVTFSSSNFADGDKITCMMTSNATCATPTTATSNEVIMGINPYVTPSVNITASTNNICPGESITFTATPVNGGTAPVYQWMVNGVNAGSNSATFSSNRLVNGDAVKCIITSNAICTTIPTASSNSILVDVGPPVSPSVVITLSSNNICYGTLVTFTAEPMNGGIAPVYEWLVNGTPTGTNSNIFGSISLNNNDVVSCRLTSNAHCAVPVTVMSNNIIMIVNTNPPASVSIAPSQNNVCEGTVVNFTAVPVNGGVTPIYQWQVNGVNAGTNSATFSSSNFADGDKLTCVMTSNATCAIPTVVTSNIVTMEINPNVTPSIRIISSKNNICPGELLTFTALSLNSGSAPAYQWQVNGINVGTNNVTFNSSTLVNGDEVRCIITSNAACIATPTAISTSIIANVSPQFSPVLTVTASTNDICYGTTVTFIATPTYGGDAPIYQWLVNGNPTGTNSNTLVKSNLNNNDIVSCRLTSNVHCAVPETVTSDNNIIMVVNPIPVVSSGGDKTIDKGNSIQLKASASGSIANITWSPSAGLDNTKTLTPTARPDKTTLYTLTVESTNGCITTGTVKVTVLVNITVPNTFTPNGDGINDRWEIRNLTDYQDSYIKVFNRWGAEVYSSSGNSGNWDGTRKGKALPVGTYYYIINLSKGTPPISGYVLLIR